MALSLHEKTMLEPLIAARRPGKEHVDVTPYIHLHANGEPTEDNIAPPLSLSRSFHTHLYHSSEVSPEEKENSSPSLVDVVGSGPTKLITCN